MPLVYRLVETEKPDEGDEWKGEVVSSITEVHLNYATSPAGENPCFSITLRQHYAGYKPQEIWLNPIDLQEIIRRINIDVEQKTVGPSEDCEVDPLDDWKTDLEEW